MNVPMTREQLAAIAVNSAELLAELVSKELQPAKRHGAPYAKRDEGRKRRKARRHARMAKAAWLLS